MVQMEIFIIAAFCHDLFVFKKKKILKTKLPSSQSRVSLAVDSLAIIFCYKLFV